MSKIYLISRKKGTIGVNYTPAKGDVSATARLVNIKADESLGYSNTGVSVVVEVLRAYKAEELGSEVHTIYIPSSVLETVNNQNYKFWLLTGCNRNGEVIEENVLNLYKELNEELKAKGDFFVFRSIAQCKINDRVKANPASLAKFSDESKVNDYYTRFCIDKADEIYPNNAVANIPEVI